MRGLNYGDRQIDISSFNSLFVCNTFFRVDKVEKYMQYRPSKKYKYTLPQVPEKCPSSWFYNLARSALLIL